MAQDTSTIVITTAPRDIAHRTIERGLTQIIQGARSRVPHVDVEHTRRFRRTRTKLRRKVFAALRTYPTPGTTGSVEVKGERYQCTACGPNHRGMLVVRVLLQDGLGGYVAGARVPVDPKVFRSATRSVPVGVPLKRPLRATKLFVHDSRHYGDPRLGGVNPNVFRKKAA